MDEQTEPHPQVASVASPEDGRRAWIGFAFGLVGVAIYVAGTFLPSFYSRTAPGFPPDSAVSVYLQRLSATSIGYGMMLYGGAVIVLILCMGGLVARRRLPWAVGLAAAAAVWVVYASGWMNNMNVDDPGGYRLTGRLFGYHEMSIGAALALIGGIVACVASLPRRTAITPPAIGDTISRGTRLTIRVGLAAGLVGAAVYLAGTFLPYGGPSRAFSAPTVTYSLVQINVIGQFRRWPLVNQLAAGAALWTAPLVVLAACGAGLLARRDPAPWVAAFTAGALVWILRVAGETVVSYVNNPATFPQLGFQLMVVGFVLVLAGTVVALVALPFLRPAAVDSADGRAFNRAMDTTGRVATP